MNTNYGQISFPRVNQKMTGVKQILTTKLKKERREWLLRAESKLAQALEQMESDFYLRVNTAVAERVNSEKQRLQDFYNREGKEQIDRLHREFKESRDTILEEYRTAVKDQAKEEMDKAYNERFLDQQNRISRLSADLASIHNTATILSHKLRDAEDTVRAHKEAAEGYAEEANVLQNRCMLETERYETAQESLRLEMMKVGALLAFIKEQGLTPPPDMVN